MNEWKFALLHLHVEYNVTSAALFRNKVLKYPVKRRIEFYLFREKHVNLSTLNSNERAISKLIYHFSKVLYCKCNCIFTVCFTSYYIIYMYQSIFLEVLIFRWVLNKVYRDFTQANDRQITGINWKLYYYSE